MAYSVWQKTITDGAGNILPGATITVTDQFTGAVVSLASDSAGTVLANPFSADGAGLARFFVQPGVYRVQAASGASSAEFTHVQIGSAQSRDVDAASGSGLLDRDALDGRYSTFFLGVTHLSEVDPHPQYANLTVLAVDPTVTDDENAGFRFNSRVVNSVTGREFVCTDATAGEAFWAAEEAAAKNWINANGGVDFSTAPTSVTGGFAAGDGAEARSWNGLAIGPFTKTVAGALNTAVSITIGNDVQDNTTGGSPNYPDIMVGKSIERTGTSSGSILMGHNIDMSGPSGAVHLSTAVNNSNINNGAVTITASTAANGHSPTGGVYIGSNAQDVGSQAVSIGGSNAVSGSGAAGIEAVRVGYKSSAGGIRSVAIGSKTKTTVTENICIGYRADDLGQRGHIFGAGDSTRKAYTQSNLAITTSFPNSAGNNEAVMITSNTATAGTTDAELLSVNTFTTICGEVSVIVQEHGTTLASCYRVNFAAQRNGNDGLITLLGFNVQTVFEDPNLVASLSVVADSVNPTLQLRMAEIVGKTVKFSAAGTSNASFMLS